MIKKIAFLALCCTYLCANDLSWSTPQLLSTTGVNASNPEIGIDASGNLVAVWIESGIVMANTQSYGGSWNVTASLVSTAGGATSLGLVVDPAGNATAIWNESGVITSASLPFGSMMWATPVALSASGSSSPQIAVDSGGDLAAIWITGGVIQALTQQFGMGWSPTPEPLSYTFASSDSPQIAFGGGQTIVAVWHSTEGGIDAVYSSTTTLGVDWPMFPSLISAFGVPSVMPQVAVNSLGVPIAVWYRYTLSGTDYSNVIVQTALGNVDGTWAEPTDLSAAGIKNPAELSLGVAFNQLDAALAIWTNAYDDSTFNLEGSINTTGSWSPITTFVSANMYLYDQNFMVSSSNYAYGAYMKYDPVSNSPIIQAFKANTYNTTLNFGNILTISNAGNNGFPLIAGTSVSSAHAVGAIWLSNNGTNVEVQTATANGAAIPAPISPTVSQNSINWGVFTEYYNTLAWSSSMPDSSSNWVIFRDGTWLQTLPVTTLTFIEHNAVQSLSVTYGVALQTEDGDLSPISTVTLP
jgi:hypothetical protein